MNNLLKLLILTLSGNAINKSEVRLNPRSVSTFDVTIYQLSQFTYYTQLYTIDAVYTCFSVCMVFLFLYRRLTSSHVCSCLVINVFG